MSSLSKKIEDLMSAISFAEEGEFETGREIMRIENSLCEKLKRLRRKVDLTLDEIDNLTSKATTFSEAGEIERSQQIMAEVNTKLERAKEICQKISNVINAQKVIPKVISSEDKSLCTSGGHKKYYYNYYRYKKTV